jgi:hypothetical protein
LWLSPLLALLICGCWETKETVTLNPDGSGKDAFETITALPPEIGSEKKEITDPQDEARKAVGKMLHESKGVEAWSDVAFSVLPDGRIRLQGVAFFPDYSKLTMPWGRSNVHWERTDNGMALTAAMWAMPNEKDPNKPAPGKPAPSTPEEIRKKVLIDRMEYRRKRPILAAFLGSLKSDTTYVLPGRIAESGAFTTTPEGLRVVFEGKKMLEVCDALTADDKLMAEIAKEGKTFEQSRLVDEYLAEKVLGRKARLRAVVTGKLAPLFDYAAESRKAKDAQDKMLETLNIK